MVGGNFDEYVSHVTSPVQHGAVGSISILMSMVLGFAIAAVLFPTASWSVLFGFAGLCGLLAAVVRVFVLKAAARRLDERRAAQLDAHRAGTNR